MDHKSCYQAVLTHDTRFDGVFFVGVSSTKIYCRTVCTAKTPRSENCKFFSTAASAEQSGFRPCLLCRPELAPGNARTDAVSRLVASAINRIEDGSLTEKRLDEFAAEMGVTDRHLRRVLQTELGVSPIALIQTQRLLLAKRLLTDTDLPITEIAFASGFASLRRFNALFKERYRLNPTELRKTRAASTSETLVCELAYRPPLDWQSLMDYLKARALAGVESVEGNRYLRTVAIDNHLGWIAVEPSTTKTVLQVEISASLAKALLPVLAGVKRVFDLKAEPLAIAGQLGELAAANPGLRVAGAFNGFEIAVRAILGQQVSVKSATTLAGRYVAKFGEPVETPLAAPLAVLTHLSPKPERVAAADLSELTSLGIIGARAKSIIALAEAVAIGKLSLSPGGNVEQTMEQLKQLPGIGEWTAQYVAMRALSWPDAFPHTDLGVYKALGTNKPKRVLEIAEAWRPWRAYAVMHLWKSLEKSEGEK
ncbi:MAG: DNA-3-methyladenine glycosylase 2 [Acidobacteriota bacterium]|nr:DNA-3-methyladenine glycosylase 2 [Acidobacteriota bacterium]